MDVLWWIIGLGVIAMIVVLSVRARGNSRTPPEDPAAERAAQEQARLEQEARDRIGPGEGSV
ncbi:hypothetical protein SAMN05428970_2771 [Agromyces sp. CF514]|uniref:hypothetical protein n=1 Tax=Agromyces sp. CF514 TaxID=1881031 RepID=UPI0008E69F31|nr:hypothetical protein [Agromyces sp. CF514]SFR83268.1 hypothetical protein SAMN05428970_2771 [Agromyces sp. CF514]